MPANAVQKKSEFVRENTVKEYTSQYDESSEQSLENRKKNYSVLVNQYYDLSTDFYEYGWGQSFHFAPRHENESVPASLARHEHFLALRLGLKPNMKTLDVGCGIGGPMIEIGRFSGANILGVNNNEYQISKGEILVEKAGLSGTCHFLKGDFMNIPQPDNSFDAVYAIEATCHAPSKEGIYAEIFRLLKPGASFAAYEWCMTDLYDPENATHREIKRLIEIGDGLPNLDTSREVVEALKKVGFEVLEVSDLAIPTPTNPVPWYTPLQSNLSSLSGLRSTTMGVWITHIMVTGLEWLSLSPKGTSETHAMLMQAHDGLARGGQTGIFTPMFYFLVRKPMEEK